MNGIDRNTGKRLSGTAHLRQSIADILSTPIGSRVLLRDYGSEVFSLVDNPEDDFTRLRIISSTAAALAKWEPRLSLQAVTVTTLLEGMTELTIDGINTETNLSETFEGITVYGNALQRN